MGRRILRKVPAGTARIVAAEISTGGGSAPDESVPSLSIEITTARDAESVLKDLRAMPVPIIAAIAEGRVRLSLATMHGEDERAIAEAIAAVAGKRDG